MSENRENVALKRARKARKWSQQEAARRLGLDQGSISKYESGVWVPTPQTALKLKKLYKLTLDEIYANLT